MPIRRAYLLNMLGLIRSAKLIIMMLGACFRFMEMRGWTAGVDLQGGLHMCRNGCTHLFFRKKGHQTVCVPRHCRFLLKIVSTPSIDRLWIVVMRITWYETFNRPIKHYCLHIFPFVIIKVEFLIFLLSSSERLTTATGNCSLDHNKTITVHRFVIQS